MTPLVRSARRPARTRLCVAVACLALAGGCGEDPGTGGAATPEAASASPGPTESASAPAGPEVGTWESAPVTRDQFLQTLRVNGFTDYVRRFGSIPGWLPDREGVLSLELRDGSWMLYGALDGDAPTVFDRQTYEVVDQGFELTSDVGQTILRPSIEGETLALEFVSSTEPAAEEIPVEAILRVYYTTATFTRIAS
ncbi:hypothetical protein [Nocardioides sp.]|uniref:hypothetical protein n=1 Tax=Nocardioides sp. TaxID=35761 RepID=UPI0035B4874F